MKKRASTAEFVAALIHGNAQAKEWDRMHREAREKFEAMVEAGILPAGVRMVSPKRPPRARERAERGSVTYQTNVRLPPEMKAPMRKAAKAAGLPSVAEWIRQVIEKALES